MKSLPAESLIKRTEYSGQYLQDLLVAVMEGTGTVGNCMKSVAHGIESFGCETEFRCLYEGRDASHRTEIQVLSLDLVWLRPGPFGSWSELGQQACFCVLPRDSGSSAANTWYGKALERFFSSHNCRSLLTYRDIYTRPVFLHLSRLEESDAPAGRTAGDAHGDQNLPHDAWGHTFHPDRVNDQSASEWTERLNDFRLAISDELGAELGMKMVSDAMLVWVYVSAGTPQPNDVPPHWAASLFMVYRFKGTSHTDRDLDLLLSNLVHSLQAASQASLPAQRKHDLAQALAHEFKNLNQDLAQISWRALDQFTNMCPPPRPPDLDDMYKTLLSMDVAAQASTALSTAAYWFAAPTFDGLEFREDDQCSIFCHILYLAIRVVAAKHKYWTLKDVPEIGAIFRFLNERLGLRGRGSATELLAQRCVSIMLFFAMEPVRNIRAQDGQDAPLELWVEAGNHQLALLHRSRQQGGDARPVISNTVAAMMDIARAWPQGSFIYIDPAVTTTLIDTAMPGVFIAEKRTTIDVQKVPYPKLS